MKPADFSALRKRQKQERAMQDRLVLDQVVSLPAIATARSSAYPIRQSATEHLPEHRDGKDGGHLAAPWKFNPLINRKNDPRPDAPSSLVEKLKSTSRKTVVTTQVPTKFFVYKTTFDAETSEDARNAEFDFTDDQGKNHLTYRIPLFPSVMPQAGDTFLRQPQRSLRHEVVFVAHVADKIFASQDNASKFDAVPDSICAPLLTTDDGDRLFAKVYLQLRQASFVLHECARITAPTCAELSDLLAAVKDIVVSIPSELARRWTTLTEMNGKLNKIVTENETLLKAVHGQVAQLRQELDLLREAQQSESQRFVNEVEEHGLRPSLEATTAKAIQVTVTTEQINYLATHTTEKYAFSSERVVAGKRFVRHPPMTKDVAVDCSDLYFDGATNPHASQAYPSQQLQFKGKTFVQPVHRVLDAAEAASLLRKKGLQILEVEAADSEPEQENSSGAIAPTTSMGDPLTPTAEIRRRPSISFKKKAVSVLKLTRLLRRPSDADAKKSLKKSPSINGPSSPVSIASATSFRRVESMAFSKATQSKTDGSTQTTNSALSVADAGIQVVEADIARKMRKVKHRTSDSALATPIGFANRDDLARPSNADNHLVTDALPVSSVTMQIDTSAWGPAVRNQLGTAPSVVPHDMVSTASNTDVLLAGFDVASLSFVDAVKVRFLVSSSDNDVDDPDLSTSIHKPHPPANAKTHGHKIEGKDDRSAKKSNELPDDVAALFGIKPSDTSRPHTLQWLNALALELVKHVDPFKMDAQRKSLSSWSFAHFRAKYGLGKMASNYMLDFLGNLKLHHHGSIRALLLLWWMDLAEFANLSAAPEFITAESLYFYAYAVQTVARSGTHKNIKDLESAELLLQPQRVEQCCDQVLRNVAASFADADDWATQRLEWQCQLLSTGSLSPQLRRLADEIQRARGKESALDLLPVSADQIAPLSRSASLDADVLTLLFVANYPALRRKMMNRATFLHSMIGSGIDEGVGFNEQGEVVQVVQPPPQLLLASLASWPVTDASQM